MGFMIKPTGRATMMFALAFFLFLSLLFSGVAQAQDSYKKFGLGIVLGEPSGLSTKVFLSRASALDFDVAYSVFAENFMFTGDYLYHFDDALEGQNSTVTIRPYIGGGGVLWLGDRDVFVGKNAQNNSDRALGVRFTGGFSFFFPKVSVEAFADLSPGVGLFPETGFIVGGVIGVRYFFL
jgi:hypothetical protein